MPDPVALIIGSGFGGFGDGQIEALQENRFGAPSAPIRRGNIGKTPLLTLARHGDQHTIPPHAINYRANLLALHDAGAAGVVALCTVGVVSEKGVPGEIAVPSQIIDYTWGRAHTVFDGNDGQVEHIDFTEPFSAPLRAALLASASAVGAPCYDGGVYGALQGPRLETAAEVDRLERDGVDYVGMTAMPEAAIAAELKLPYACVALLVNMAAGRGEGPIHDDVAANNETARNLTKSVLRHFLDGENQANWRR